MKDLKKSVIPGAIYNLVQFYVMFLPSIIVGGIATEAGEKHTLLYTNVPGFVKPVYFGGQPVKKQYLVTGGLGNICTGIAIISICKRF